MADPEQWPPPEPRPTIRQRAFNAANRLAYHAELQEAELMLAQIEGRSREEIRRLRAEVIEDLELASCALTIAACARGLEEGGGLRNADRAYRALVALAGEEPTKKGTEDA